MRIQSLHKGNRLPYLKLATYPYVAENFQPIKFVDKNSVNRREFLKFIRRPARNLNNVR